MSHPHRRLFSAVTSAILVSFAPAALAQAPRLVKRVLAAPASGSPSETATATNLYFRGYDDGGAELWKSDGTTAGTARVKDIFAGSQDSSPAVGSIYKGSFFFNAFVPATVGPPEQKFFRSDGTQAGTIVPFPAPSSLSVVTSYLGDLFLYGSDGLYRTNGTALSKVGDGIVVDTAIERTSVAVNGILYFGAHSSTQADVELYRTDGTALGTKRVKDIRVGTRNSFPQRFVELGGHAVFLAFNDDSVNRHFWRTDGTEAGTTIVRPDVIVPGGIFAPTFFVKAGSKAYFQGSSAAGSETWVTDGTTAGTLPLGVNKTQVEGTQLGAVSFGAGPDALLVVDGSSLGPELWRTDGTPAGTKLVKDIRPGADGSAPADFFRVGSTVYFNADDGLHGREIWKTDGTAAGTVMVGDLSTFPSEPTYAAKNWVPRILGATATDLFFAEDDGSAPGTAGGWTLWALALPPMVTMPPADAGPDATAPLDGGPMGGDGGVGGGGEPPPGSAGPAVSDPGGDEVGCSTSGGSFPGDVGIAAALVAALALVRRRRARHAS